jgi:hypothetical protein
VKKYSLQAVDGKADSALRRELVAFWTGLGALNKEEAEKGQRKR